jgi:hypothetical protein
MIGLPGAATFVMALNVTFVTIGYPLLLTPQVRLNKYATKSGQPAFVAIRLCYDDRDDIGFGGYSALLRRRAV